jgi:hypothetical protein
MSCSIVLTLKIVVVRPSPQFIPYHISIDGLEPNNTIIHLAQAPTREVIAQKIQAMHNSAINNPPFTERASTTQCKLGREVWRKICHDGVYNQVPQHGQMR